MTELPETYMTELSVWTNFRFGHETNQAEHPAPPRAPSHFFLMVWNLIHHAQSERKHAVIFALLTLFQIYEKVFLGQGPNPSSMPLQGKHKDIIPENIFHYMQV